MNNVVQAGILDRMETDYRPSQARTRVPVVTLAEQRRDLMRRFQRREITIEEFYDQLPPVTADEITEDHRKEVERHLQALEMSRYIKGCKD